MEKDKVRMTFDFNELDTSSVLEWIKKVEEIFQESKKKKLLENRKEYDHVIELM